MRYTNGTESMSHSGLQARLNVSFPKNTPPEGWEVYTPPPKPEPTEEQIKRRLTNAVQRHLDETARERSYDNILSLCTYATSTNDTFAAEGQAGVEWRDAVWSKCYQILNEVKAGDREQPTEDELLADLPGFTWPE